MKVWRIKLRHVGDPLVAKRVVIVPPGFVPTRVRGLKALERVKLSPSHSWPVSALFGFYVERYEDRYKRAWPFSAAMSKTYLDDLLDLAQRVGMAEAAVAVKVVFGMDWITGEHMQFLRDQDKYARFVIPELEKRKPKRGEQSEWSGSRDEVQSGQVDAEAFFYGKERK